MERYQFVEQNPELAAQQENEGRKSIHRILIIVTFGISSVLGLQYATNSEFQLSIDKIIGDIVLAAKDNIDIGNAFMR